MKSILIAMLLDMQVPATNNDLSISKTANLERDYLVVAQDFETFEKMTEDQQLSAFLCSSLFALVAEDMREYLLI